MLFEVRTDGSVTTHVSFASSNPLSALAEGADGNLYFISSRSELIRLLPGVALRIVRSFHGLAIAWPSEVEGYTLQSTEPLQPPVWKTVISPQPLRGYAMWTNASGLEGRFFRLVRDE